MPAPETLPPPAPPPPALSPGGGPHRGLVLSPFAPYRGIVRRFFVVYRHVLGLLGGGLVAYVRALPPARRKGIHHLGARIGATLWKPSLMCAAQNLRKPLLPSPGTGTSG